jgi:hypothetical protein
VEDAEADMVEVTLAVMAVKEMMVDVEAGELHKTKTIRRLHHCLAQQF